MTHITTKKSIDISHFSPYDVNLYIQKKEISIKLQVKLVSIAQRGLWRVYCNQCETRSSSTVVDKYKKSCGEKPGIMAFTDNWDSFLNQKMMGCWST